MKTYYVDVPLADLLAKGYEPHPDEKITVRWLNGRNDGYFEHITKGGTVKMRLFSIEQWRRMKNSIAGHIGQNTVYRIPADYCTVSRPATLVSDQPD